MAAFTDAATGLASTGVVGADRMVTAAAMKAAVMMTAVGLIMKLP
jgi:hypothetical protein